MNSYCNNNFFELSEKKNFNDKANIYFRAETQIIENNENKIFKKFIEFYKPFEENQFSNAISFYESNQIPASLKPETTFRYKIQKRINSY